jgi:hypothetical protein
MTKREQVSNSNVLTHEFESCRDVGFYTALSMFPRLVNCAEEYHDTTRYTHIYICICVYIYIYTYLLTHSFHGAEYYLKS